jgi:DNA-binding transcriptional MerR regulator
VDGSDVEPNWEPSWGIADLAAEFGLTARTIRHYEDAGLIAPARDGTVRVYARRDRARLALICRGKRLGFTLAEIRDFLDLYDIDEGQVGQMAFLLTKARARIAGLERQMDDVRRTLDELRQLEAAIVDHLADRGVDPPCAANPARQEN